MTPVGEILMSLAVEHRPGRQLPELLCQDACRRLPVSAAGIALMDRSGRLELSVGSGPRAHSLEELQLTTGEGPCLDAFTTGRLALHPDLAVLGAGRWPAYTPAALALGVRAIFCYPLRIGAIRFGALDLYNDRPGPLAEAALQLALHYVEATLMILLHLQSVDDAERVGGAIGSAIGMAGESRLEIAFGRHGEVHQATGMVSVQADVGLDDALMLLRAHAFAADRSLSQVAYDVLDRRLVFD